MASRQKPRSLRAFCAAAVRSASVFVRDVAHGLVEVTHNAFALIGLVLAAVVLFAVGRADIRHEAEIQALGWLQARHEAPRPPTPLAPETAAMAAPAAAPAPAPTLAATLSEPDASVRATASDLKDLSRPQAAVAVWLARRYKVAPEPVGALVKEAWQVGNKAGLDPTLILAIMAVESSFNPFAQSTVGAQGLMQVMTRVHNAKYDAFGGKRAAFDPVTNLRVGVEVLKECISRAGSLEAGLRFYVGAGKQEEDGGYAGRVLSEQTFLKMLVGGKSPPSRAPAPPSSVATPKVEVPAAPAEEAHPASDQIALLH